MRYLVIFLLLVSCRSMLPQKQSFNDFPESQYLVNGCQIYTMNGDIKKSYPGGQCLFFPDGKLLSYDFGKMELSLYSPKLSILWTKRIHVHHDSLKLTKEGHLYFLSSSIHPLKGIKKVRFDELILMNVSNGEVLKSFSIYKNLSKLGKVPLNPYRNEWEKNLGHTHEATHMPALYQIKAPLKKNGEVIVPEGSFLLTSNTNLPGVYAIDSTLSRLIGKWRVTNFMFYHDVQPYSSHELIFLINTKFIKPVAKDETARIAIYDFNEEKITQEYYGNFFALFSGGVQVLNRDLLLVSDSGSTHGLKTEDLEADGYMDFRIEEHKKKKARAILYSLREGVLDEIHFDFANQHFRVLDLSDFLQNNIGI